MSGLYDEIVRLLEVHYAEHRARAPRAAHAIFRLVEGEPIGRLVAEAIRSSAPTLPPPADDTPVPSTKPLGPTPGTKGKP